MGAIKEHKGVFLFCENVFQASQVSKEYVWCMCDMV